MDYESFMNLVRTRRSHWHFRSEDVSDDYIERIVDAARYAPSAFNSQPWEFVVLKDQALRDGITGIVANGMPAPPPMPDRPHEVGAGSPFPGKDPLGFRTAPVFVLVLGDPRVRAFGPSHMRNDDGRWESACTTSLAAAYEHMHLAAASLGLATRWVSAVSDPQVAKKIREFLGIPEVLLVYEMMALGYSDFEPSTKKMRELREVLHYGRCGEGEFRTPGQIAEYFAR